MPAEELREIDAKRREARVALVEGREPGITPVRYSRPPSSTIRTSSAHAPSPTAATRGRRPKRIITGYGFWIFLLSDFIMFSGFYAAYAVLSHATAGGPRRENSSI